MTKFPTYIAAVEAAKAHNIAIVGGGTGNGYIINHVRACGGCPGFYEACAKYPGGEHRVRPI